MENRTMSMKDLLEAVSETNLSNLSDEDLDIFIDNLIDRVKNTRYSQSLVLKSGDSLDITLECLSRRITLSIASSEIQKLTRDEIMASIEYALGKGLDAIYVSMRVNFGSNGFSHVIAPAALISSDRRNILLSLNNTIDEKIDRILYADTLKEVL
jgi:hypothetical protein